MTDFDPNNANEWNFDPSIKARLQYKDSGMSKSTYVQLKNRWLRNAAAAEGKEFRTGYAPQGYSRIWSTQSGQKKNTVYWKPEAYAKHLSTMPQMEWDTTKDVQNYWHNPTNVVSWANRLRIQGDDYEPPDWLDTKFVEAQYDALKHYNGDEDDPLYWKPLPLGSEDAYLTNFYSDPNGNIPVYDSVLKQITQGEGAVVRLQRQMELAETEYARFEQEQRAEQEAWLTDVNTDQDTKSVVAKLNDGVQKGFIDQAMVDDATKYFQEQGLYPLEDGSFVSAPDVQPEGGDYANLYPWQKFFQTIGGQVAMKNQPEGSQNLGKLLQAALPALGIGGMAQMAGTTAVALSAGKGLLLTGAAKAVTAAGITVLGLPAVPVIIGGAAILGLGTLAYIYMNRDNPNATVLQNIFRYWNQTAEAPERAMGAVDVAAQLNERGEEVDWSAAYDAGYMNYEMGGLGFGKLSNFIYNAASVISEGIDRVGLMFGKDWDLGSGEITADNEIWDFKEGYTAPKEAEIDLGEGLLISYEQMKALGNQRTRQEMEQEWAYLTSFTGNTGTLADFMGQSFIDLSNLIPAGMDKAAELHATAQAKKFMALGDVQTSRAFTTLAKSYRGAIGNPAIDALPMGIQQIAERVTKGWDGRAAWLSDVKNLKTAVDFKVWKNLPENKFRSISPWARGSLGIPDALNTYMARMTVGYEIPGSKQFYITPGGKLSDTIGIVPSSDGSLMIYKGDGTTYSYTPDNLKKLDIKLLRNDKGTLTIAGVKNLFKEVGIDTKFATDMVHTTMSWEHPVDPKTGETLPTAERVDAADAEFSDSGDPNTYNAKIGDKTYTAIRGSDYVTKIVNADGDIVPLDKPMRLSESPRIVGDDFLSAAQEEALYGLITVAGTEYARYIPTDYKSPDELNKEGLRAFLTSIKVPGVDKLIKKLVSLSDLTPGTKAMLEAENVQLTLEHLFFFSGNNFELTVSSIKKLLGGIDTGRVTKAAEAFLNGGSTTAAVAAAIKHAWADGSLLDSYVDLYRDTMPDRAALTKIAKQIGIAPEKLVAMTPKDIFNKLKNIIIAKNDPVSQEMLRMISVGALSEESINKSLSKFVGKHAAPISDQGFLASVALFTDKAVQDFLIDKYGVKKLPTWARLSAGKKAMLSPLLISYPYTTWLNNLYSNVGAQIFLTGGVSLEGKSGIAKIAETIGLKNMPAEYSKRMGLGDDLIKETNKISLTMNPNDSLGKAIRKLRNWGGAIKAYSKIEQFNTASLFVQEVKNLHARILLPEFPVNIKQKLLDAGMTEQQISYIKHYFNRQMSADGVKGLVAGLEYGAIDHDLFNDLGRSIFPDNEQNAALVQDLAMRLFDDDNFIEAIKKVTSPEDTRALTDVVVDAFEKQIDAMTVNNYLQTRFEVENIYTKEGMAGGIHVFVDMMLDEIRVRGQNSAAWGDAMARAELAKRNYDYKMYEYIIEKRRAQANKMFTRSSLRTEAMARGLMDVLKAGDADAELFAGVIANRHQRGSLLLKQIDDNYHTYFDTADDMTPEQRVKTWDAIAAKNEALMDNFDKLEVESLTTIADIFVKLLGGKVVSDVSRSGLSSTDLQAGGKKMMTAVIKGLTELNELRKQHFTGLKDLSGNARVAANMSFWNTVWNPKAQEIQGTFVDGNWKTFFQTTTDFEKENFPGMALSGEPAKRKTAKTATMSEAETDLMNRLAADNMDAENRAKIDAVKAAADGEIIKRTWIEDFIAAIGDNNITEGQIGILNSYLDTLDFAYSRRTGKPAGSWWRDEMNITVTKVKGQSVPVSTATGVKTDAAAFTRVKSITDKIYEIVVSEKTNFSTALRELDRIIWFSDLLTDYDKAVIARELGGIDLARWKQIELDAIEGDLSQRAKANDTAAIEDLKIFEAVVDGFADTHRRWLVKDASKAAPTSKLIEIFSTVSILLDKLVQGIGEKLGKTKLSKSVAEVFEYLHGFKETDAAVQRNASRLSQVPRGNPIMLNKPLARAVEIVDGVRTTEAYNVAKGVNAGIAETLERLNASDYKTHKSSSGMTADYPETSLKPGYISFKIDDIGANRAGRIETAAKKAGLFPFRTKDGDADILRVELPLTMDLTPAAELQKLILNIMPKEPKTEAGKKLWQANYNDAYIKATERVIKLHGGRPNDAQIEALWKDFGEQVVKKNKAKTAETYPATPKVVSINGLITAYRFDPDTNRISVNKKFDQGHWLTPPKYTFEQLRDMARSLNPEALISGMKAAGDAAILVDKNGMVLNATDTVLALMYAAKYEPSLFAKYQSELHRAGYNFGFTKNSLDTIDDGVLVLQVGDDWDRTARFIGEDAPKTPADIEEKRITKMVDGIEDKLYPYLFDKKLLKKKGFVLPEEYVKELTDIKLEVRAAFDAIAALKETGVSVNFEDYMLKLDNAYRGIDLEIKKIMPKQQLNVSLPTKDSEGRLRYEKGEGTQFGLTQPADEIQARKWYFHKTRKLAEGLKQNIFTPDQLRAAFSGAKQEEIRLLDLESLLETSNKITKDDVLAWIDAHSLNVREVEYTGRGYDADADPATKTQYDMVNIPGGENYRELLLTVPDWAKKYQSQHWLDTENVLLHLRFDERIDPVTGKKVLNVLELQSDWIQQGKYGFRGEPDTKLIAKATKYVDALAFESREPGIYAYWYRRGTNYEQRGNFIARNGDDGYSLFGNIDQAINNRPLRGIIYPTLEMAKEALRNSLIDSEAEILRYERPVAPPLTKFGLLGLKRMLQQAVADGYDILTFSTGSTAAEIEGISILANTNRIRYNENDWMLEVSTKDGKTKEYPLDLDEFALSKHVGDDIAKQVMEQPVGDEGWRTLDLTEPIKFGGEKMKWWYDRELVNDLNGYLKQWGMKIEDGEIALDEGAYIDADLIRGQYVPDTPMTKEEVLAYIASGKEEDVWFSEKEVGTAFGLLRQRLNSEAYDVIDAMLEKYDIYSDESVQAKIREVGRDTRPVHKVVINDKFREDVLGGGQALLQPASEIPPTVPITERPVASEPMHMDTAAGNRQLMDYDLPAIANQMVDLLGQRMQAGAKQAYKMDIPDAAAPAMKDLIDWASEQQRLRMSTILDGANRTARDIMIDYSRRRGIDQLAEVIFPYQFWYTRSMLMWMKRMVAKPSVMTMAYRYMELRRRNEMTGFPSRQGGKSPFFAPWLPDGMGDWMFSNPWGKFFTPEQLFQPLQTYANLDAEVATEAQRYIYELMKQGTISPEAAKKAAIEKTGTIWEDAVQYTRLNSMPNETDPFSMVSMFINPDPMINALYQTARGTPEKISPLPLTRLGNSFQAIGGGDMLGIIGAVLSAPEDFIREKAGLPQAGEYGDYYVDFFLANMSVTSNYTVDQIKQAMISRSGAAFDEATKMAQVYIAYRTPGTAFYKAVKDKVWKENPKYLADAFLASFFPAGLFPEGEMELRGLKDEYNEAWDDYTRGDEEALERFNQKYPEYETRMMMFQEPTERLRGHLINMIWETYTALPTANQQIAADSMGDAFKAYFLDKNTRNYEKIDEGTLTTWARKLGYQAPAMQGVNDLAAKETVDPMKLYPEDTAATIQTFLDQRNEMFPNYFMYQGVYFKLPEEKREAFLKKFPIVKDYWDWKDEQATTNPTIASYLDARAAAADGYDTEYDVEAVGQMLSAFDDKLLQNVIYYQFTGEPMSTGTKASLMSLFEAAGKPGGDFNIWLQVILGE